MFLSICNSCVLCQGFFQMSIFTGCLRGAGGDGKAAVGCEKGHPYSICLAVPLAIVLSSRGKAILHPVTLPKISTCYWRMMDAEPWKRDNQVPWDLISIVICFACRTRQPQLLKTQRAQYSRCAWALSVNPSMGSSQFLGAFFSTPVEYFFDM